MSCHLRLAWSGWLGGGGAFCMILYAAWHCAAASFTYLQMPWRLLPCVCASEMQCRVFGQSFLLKTMYHLQLVSCLLRFRWGRVHFLEKVKALIKASWNYFMTEMQAGRAHGNQSRTVGAGSCKDWRLSKCLTMVHMKKDNLYENAVLLSPRP